METISRVVFLSGRVPMPAGEVLKRQLAQQFTRPLPVFRKYGTDLVDKPQEPPQKLQLPQPVTKLNRRSRSR